MSGVCCDTLQWRLRVVHGPRPGWRLLLGVWELRLQHRAECLLQQLHLQLAVRIRRHLRGRQLPPPSQGQIALSGGGLSGCTYGDPRGASSSAALACLAMLGFLARRRRSRATA